MCLIAIAYRANPDFPLVLLANRDEFYDRPTAPLHFWDDHPGIAAGRDLDAGGTWLGVTRGGRFAALTNVREPPPRVSGPRSRGDIVTDFLTSAQSPAVWLASYRDQFDQFQGFNLLFGSLDEGLYFTSNRLGTLETVSPGVHGLSNGSLNDDWPKVRGLCEGLTRILATETTLEAPRLQPLLVDRTQPEDGNLPDTGVGLDLERLLAPRFIVSEGYGTRSSSIVIVNRGREIRFSEYRYPQSGECSPPETSALDWQVPNDI
ncbi:conserved hypothetical protein [Luminiphilus syltensis NOR5-1B]|uniref:NRDE family protein n=1 Tax=Luminiphilus syltensis NOR5-1B TaxID=565045 RepID=B8KTK4_9GAMM|nr:NRDE family protein [Luminiphilus syltensis]EED34930.1 conserved hypothetical protein [Luminiphilus syltensis NOR5-1B]